MANGTPSQPRTGCLPCRPEKSAAPALDFQVSSLPFVARGNLCPSGLAAGYRLVARVFAQCPSVIAAAPNVAQFVPPSQNANLWSGMRLHSAKIVVEKTRKDPKRHVRSIHKQASIERGHHCTGSLGNLGLCGYTAWGFRRQRCQCERKGGRWRQTIWTAMRKLPRTARRRGDGSCNHGSRRAAYFSKRN